MRTTLCIFILIITVANVTAQKKEFAWLEGTWKLKDKQVFEVWVVGKDGRSLDGVSYKVKGADTVITERTKFIQKEDSFYYIPDVPENQAPVEFRITSAGANGFVAENPKHDFPKLIRYNFYRKDGRDFIDAAIEGDGKVIPYAFERFK